MEVRFTQSARKHRVGKAHVLEALANAGDPVVTPASDGKGDDRLSWVAQDDRGLELEIIGLQLPDHFPILRAMPTALRGK